MACEVSETYKLDCVLCHWRDLTATHYCRHLAVDTPCSEEGLTMTEWQNHFLYKPITGKHRKDVK